MMMMIVRQMPIFSLPLVLGFPTRAENSIVSYMVQDTSCEYLRLVCVHHYDKNDEEYDQNETRYDRFFL